MAQHIDPNGRLPDPASTPPPEDLLTDAPLFAHVFWHSPIGMTVTAPDGRLVAANAVFAGALGLAASEIVGRTPAELGFGYEDFPALLSAHPPAQTDVPLRLTSRDGRQREFVASVQSVEFRGAPHTIGLFHEVTDVTGLADRLAQSEARFQLFFENTPLALVVSDPADGSIVDANPAACRQYGYSRNEMLALPVEALGPLDGDAPAATRHHTGAGRPLDVEVTTFGFELDDRSLAMSALSDVTEQTAATEALRQSEQRFRLLAELSNDGMWEWDLLTNRIRDGAGAPLQDRPLYDAAQPWLAGVHPDDRDRGQAEFEAAMAAGQPTWSSEYRVRQPDGEWARVLQRGAILYEDGRPMRAIGATVDITAPLEVAEAEARAAQAERERLARDLHDSVTQSLYSVTLLAEAARRHAVDGQHDEAADFITRLGGLAHQALRQMRLLVYELRPAVLDSEGLVGALRHRLDAVEKRAGIAVNLVTLGERLLPRPLQGEMYHIAHEALNNALKHAAATSVTVRLDTLGDHASLEVSDDGRGFDPAATPDGPGLSTIRECCARLGGALTIRSAPGQGTTVHVLLPVR